MILERARLLFPYLRKRKPDVTIGVGDFVLAFVSRTLGIPSIMFYDDYEFKINYRLSQLFGTELVVPFALPNGWKIRKYRSFKEASYLHPKVYKPDPKHINQLDLRKNDYVFLREVAGISMNYAGLKEEGLLPFARHMHDKGMKVVMLLEDETKMVRYAKYGIVLKQPLEDLYSIMAFASFAISSGDSMARESALLGVPCIYTGGRDMYVNNPFIRWGGIIKAERTDWIIKEIEKLSKGDYKRWWSKEIKERYKDELEYTTDSIMAAIESKINKR